MHRKHHQRYQGRFTCLANLARSLTTLAAAALLLVFTVTLVIMPMPVQAQGNAQSATYRVAFEGKFAASALASGVSVPSGEHFTTLIGAVHNGSVTFWSDGGTASAGIESMAELGGTSTFKSEINAAMPNALAVIEQSIVSGGTATATVDITLTTDHPLVTLTSMVAPSPDWFVGVSGLPLRNTADDGWQPSLTVDLFPYDAGTEDGTEFSLTNDATSPQGTIASIKGTGKFSNEPIATLVFDLLAAPVITTTSPILVPENETAVATLTASDDDTPIADLTWTIPSGTDGGADADHFTLSEGGILAFSAAKDYEAPDDVGADGTYEVTVQVSDGTETDSADLVVTLENVVELTTFSGPTMVTFAENGATRVATFSYSSDEDRDGIQWLTAGVDRGLFSLDSPSGALRFLQAPDFENPLDVGPPGRGTNNSYELKLVAWARDSGSIFTDEVDVKVTVTDVDEAGALSLSSTRPALGAVLRAVLTDPDGVTAGTALWQWERSTGRNSWAVIDGAASASYTPVAADTNTFLRVTATYEDEHGTGKTVSEVPPNVVTGPLLTGLTAESDDSQADSARGLYPAFDPLTLHYGIGCTSTDTLVLTVSAAANARVAVAGVQAASAPMAVDVSEDSEVAIRVTDASGAGTTYVVHCLSEVFFQIETHTFPNTDAFEDLILFQRPGYFTLMDRNGVPRLRRAHSNLGGFAIRFYRIGIDGAYRYGFGNNSGYTVLDEDFEVVEDNVRTVGASLTPINPHDFQILENGNYLLTANPTVMGDFRDFDLPSPAAGGVDLSSVAVWDQTIQIVTPEPAPQAVFTWGSWGNIAAEDCVQHRFPVRLSTDPQARPANPDIAHFNGAHMVDGVVAISLRGCSKVLGIDVATGDVAWRMGRTNLSDEEWSARDIGPRPLDFINDPEGEFCGQHSARILPNGNVFLFDNGSVCVIDPWTFEELGREGSDFSRGVEYALDFDNHEAVFVRDHSLRRTRDHLGYANGTVFALDNGDWLVSWGRPLNADVTIPDNEGATLVDPATGQEKLGLRFRELPASERSRRINATVAPAEALAPQPEPLTALLPSSSHTSVFHTGAGDSPQVVVAFNQPVVDFDETTPSLNVTGATVASVSLHVVAGESANAYVVTLTPAGASNITIGLVADQPCADGGICTAGEILLSEVPASHDIRADTTPPAVSKIEITSDPGTDRTYVPGDEIRVTVTFSELVLVMGTPQLMLEVGNEDRTAAYRMITGPALVFAYTVDEDDDSPGVSLKAGSIDLNGGMIIDRAGNFAVLVHGAVDPQSGHKVDGVRPELAAGVGTVVDGTTLTLTYNEQLDSGSVAEPGDFTVDGGDQARTVTQVVVSGKAVKLTMDVGAEHAESEIRVSYTPGVNPIRDLPGNEAEVLSRVPVSNETPDTTAPGVISLAISSNPGSDQAYAVEDVIEVTVTFSETVEVTGTPQLRLRVGSSNRTADYLRGTDTEELVFGYEVADGHEDTDGVSIEAGRITLNGGTIEDEADNPAELAHEAVAAQVGHKVDGVRPNFQSAAVDGSSLTLTYGETLDGGSRPAPEDFTVEVEGSGRSASGISISGRLVTLTLNPAVEHEDTGIRVSYTPDTNPIRDAVGNDALGLSSQSVANTTGAPNTAPEITSPSSFDVPENQTLVRRLAARDDDPGDEVTGWSIVGGADGSQFSITSDTGDLSFQEAPDYESPTDVVSSDPPSGARDNEYVVTVEVRSGAGTRELEAEQTFTLTVTDEREPPGVPEAPTFSAETAESLMVNWREPDNTGPAITDYDVRYREGNRGGFTDAEHMGPGLSLTLDDLEPGTAYEVQVRATNDEGTSDWSEPGEGMTVTPLTIEMMGGTEPPVEGPFTVRFSFSEPVRGFTQTAIETAQDPACTDDQNNPVFCDPVIGPLETVDDRVFSTTVTPETDRVAHNYTLTLTVSGGAVRSSVGNKPNEEAMLGGRVAPPGVTLPISEIGLRASGLDRAGRLNWNRPGNDGSSPIIRYEYRYAPVGEVWNDWENVGAGATGVTVGNLVNGLEYVFEVRAVNALGKGPVEMAAAIPVRRTGPPPPPPPPPPPGPQETVPDAPTNLLADGGDEQVALSWDAPEDDGGPPITDYEYRIDGEGEWISTGSTDTTHTVTGLTNGTAHVFEVRAVNAAGNSPSSNRSEATPGVGALDFAHFAKGAGITSALVLVNVAPHPIRPALYFYDKEGHPIDPESVVDLTEDLEITEDGSLTVRTEMEPLGELTISTHGRGELVTGSVKVASNGPIGGVLRFGLPDIGVAGVGAGLALTDAIFPARRQAGGISTAAAIHNLGEEAMGVSCQLMKDGAVLEEVEVPLMANGQEARYIEELFTGTDTSDFVGSVRCTAPEGGRFTGVAVELDVGNQIFTTLPVVPVARTGGGGQEAGLDFAHFANGAGIISGLVLVNRSTQPSGPGPSPLHPVILSSRPALYFYDKEGHPIDPESVVDLTEDLEITEDGSLTVRTEMEPLGELTISTHGQGELVTGSVKVISDGPIGGVLRFDLPGIGVAGVGASQPVRDALFPARRQAGGISTAAAIHNLEEEAMVVSCRLMQGGAVLEEMEIYLEANGQEARYIEQMFTNADTADFVGSVRCTALGLFTGVAVELDASNQIFTTLPVVPVEAMPRAAVR